MSDRLNWNDRGVIIDQFNRKHDLMISRGHEEVGAMEFYRELFPQGSLQEKYNDGKGNIVCTRLLIPSAKKAREEKARERGQKRAKIINPQWIIGDDLAELEKAIEPTADRYALLPPISFFGGTHSKQNADSLFAFVVDIDEVGEAELKNLLKQISEVSQRKILPPTYITSSGTGVHLYYFLQSPVRLYPNMQPVYSALKKAFILYAWTGFVSQKEDITGDIKPILQGFRAVGSMTKTGMPYIVRAYRVSGQRYTLEQIRDSIPDCEISLAPSDYTMPLAQAMLEFPEWYARRIIRKEPKKERAFFYQSPAMYEWYKREIMRLKIKPGSRYHSIIGLCAMGLKCNIPDREIRKDARSFLEYYESITNNDNNHFTEGDIEDALHEALKKENRERTKHTPKEWIEDNCNVKIEPKIRRREKGKRLKQVDHLREARAIRDIRQARQGKTWNGRKSKAEVVQEWRESHPDGTKSQCRAETGLAWDTIRKHWNAAAEQERKQGMRIEQIIRFDVHTLAEVNEQIDRLQEFLDSLTKEEQRAWYRENRATADRLMELLEEYAGEISDQG